MNSTCERCGKAVSGQNHASITICTTYKVVYAWNMEGRYCADCAGRLVEQLREGMPFPDRFDGASHDAIVASELMVIEEGMR